MRELIESVFVDCELGQAQPAIRPAAAGAQGPPALASALPAAGPGGGGSWVHETAPEYVTRAPSTAVNQVRTAQTVDRGAGVGRLSRAVAAALALAARGRHARALRVLERAAGGLEVRSARTEAARAWCALGDVHLARGRPQSAAAAFDRARHAGPDPRTSVRALVGSGLAHFEEGRLSEAEAAFRTATLATEHRDLAESAHVHLARTLWLRRHFEAAREALGNRSPELLSRIYRSAGDLSAAARAANDALQSPDVSSDDDRRVEAHLAAADVNASLGDADAGRRHAACAVEALRCARRPSRRLVVVAEVLAVLERCGVAARPSRRRQLLRAARRLAPLAGAQMRSALLARGEDDPELRRFADRSGAALLLADRDDRSDLIRRFQYLLDAVHAAGDEAGALQVVADDLLTSASACAVIIRSVRLNGIAASAGRSWPGEALLTRPLLDGADGLFRHAAAPEAAEPVRAAGSTLGAVAVRWVIGAAPPTPAVRDLLRVAAAASAPLLRALAVPAPEPAGAETQFPDHLFGRSPSADRIRDAIRRAATAPYAVLIEGESGSGKELVARAIHARCLRRARRFCAINCAALTDDLLEAELFGHARGAFTGALTERQGLFEEADQGTLFLDEVGELSPRAQAKLLRVLQEGEVRRVGENLPRRVDTRIVAATNRSIEEDVRAGRFRADLRFRLDVIRIALPPLRDRADEVPWLVERLWTEAASRVGTRATLGDDVIAALARYDWPGNVRELQNAMASLAVHAPRRGRVPASLLPEHIAASGTRGAARGLDEARVEFERRFVRAALARAGGRRGLAAGQLGVSRQGLAKLIKRLGICHERPDSGR